MALGKMALGLAADGCHHLDRLHRIGAGSGLAGEHDAVGAVIDGVRDIGDLGACRTRVADHGVEHLRGRYDRLVVEVALLDDLLLHMGHFGRRDLDAQIAACDHDAVGDGEDLVEVGDTQRALDLGEDEHVVRTCVVADLADALDRRGIADEARSDGVGLHLAGELDVEDVLLGDGGKADGHVGHVDTLALAQLSPVGDHAGDVVAIDALDLQANQAVVDEDDRAGLDLGGKVGIIDREARRGSLDDLGGHDHMVARRQGHLRMVLEHARADLGTLGVEQDGDGDAELGGHRPHALDVGAMVLVAAVAEVETCDVHACDDHLTQDIVIIGCGTHGADDLRTLLQTIFVRFVSLMTAPRETQVGTIACNPYYKPCAPPRGLGGGTLGKEGGRVGQI